MALPVIRLFSRGSQPQHPRAAAHPVASPGERRCVARKNDASRTLPRTCSSAAVPSCGGLPWRVICTLAPEAFSLGGMGLLRGHEDAPDAPDARKVVENKTTQ